VRFFGANDFQIPFYSGANITPLQQGGIVSRSLNRVSLIGNVGADPDIRTTPGGGRVAQFSLATTRQWNSQSGEKQEKTEWHRIVAWDNARGSKLAGIIEQYVKKGDKLYVEGRIEYRQWQDKENQTRYSTEINANEIILLGGGRGGGGEEGGRAPRSSPPKARPSAPAEGGDFEEFGDADGDDDLPF
jgi:single-strand DNA-binding protein